MGGGGSADVLGRRRASRRRSDFQRDAVLADPDNAYALPFLREGTGDLDPSRVAPRTVWSFSVGADLARAGLPVTVQIDVLNAFDKKSLYNFQSVFGGTHVIPPRTVAGRVRLAF